MVNDRTNVFNNAWGAFSMGSMYPKVTGGTSGTGSNNIQLDASRSSAVYGNSSTVTPRSYTTVFLIKY